MPLPPPPAAIGKTMIIFDVGETLVSETAIWHRIAGHLDLPPFTVSAAAGIALARNFGFAAILKQLSEFSAIPGEPWRRPDLLSFTADDLYEDVLPALAQLARDGHEIGICGNQPASSEQILANLPCQIDWLSSSARLKCKKPDPAFFHAIVDQTGYAPENIVYVGDRLDNDIYPALENGLQAVWLLRGPWSFAQWHENGVPDGICAIKSLAELPALLTA
ncbi:HAD family hydrolase [Thalassospira profundimaris]|uniref:HAD family hydrolase n=1 Tax=Thalassospira profundimaris TaxID=502049 RepID=UPI0015EFE3A4|nr:HAD family hydrolase [Thalassospira profundimaris]